ncbi:hypothetical protein HK103_007472 [Boothiomyces macroporosus]|uniref:Uncharacterized protein n=1 Tax=Boothiomyces macroporosus TaxID=261099 RepID=A0AAD5Y6D5_9FUNG|nr:hypothetical protein HK103_007472 [Boothiomyces macroporosus]
MFDFLVIVIVALTTMVGISIPQCLISFLVVNYREKMKAKMVFVKQRSGKLLQEIPPTEAIRDMGFIERIVFEAVIHLYLFLVVVLGFDIDDKGLSLWNSSFRTLKVDKTHYKLREKENGKKMQDVCDQLSSVENEKRALEKELNDCKNKESKTLEEVHHLREEIVVSRNSCDSLRSELIHCKTQGAENLNEIKELWDQLIAVKNAKSVQEMALVRDL